MLKSWPFVVAVVVVGGMAGAAIAGRRVPSDHFVLDPSITVARSTSSSTVLVATTSISGPATPVSVAPTTVAPTTVAPTTVAPTTVAPTTVAPTTTVPASTTVAPTSAPPTEAPTPTEASAAATIPGPLLRNQVRLVIANGDGRFRLASITADRVRSLGYIITLGDAFNRVDATIIYYRPGFDDEAAYAAIDIGVPDATIIAFPVNASQPITDSDAGGDVIIVLGPDAPRG